MKLMNVKGLTEEENAELNALLTQLRAKAPRNLMRLRYYEGKHAAMNVSQVIPPQYTRMGIVLGWSAKAVDMLARRCTPERFSWVDGDLEDWHYSRFRDQNRLMATIKKAVVSSLIFGVSWLVNSGTTLVVKDALNGTGRWKPDTDRLETFLAVHSWDKHGRSPTRFTLYFEDAQVTCTERSDGWVLNRSTHRFGVPVEPVLYQPWAGREFGTSRISRPIMSLHDQALRTVIRMEGHMDVYSYPEFWLLGADESIFINEDGSRKSEWEVRMGRIKGIPDDEEAVNARAEVRHFPAASPEPHLKALRQQAQLFSGEASIPLSSLGVSDQSNPTSADSYVASREDLIADAEGATDDWSPSINRAVARGLASMRGHLSLPEELESLKLSWRPPVYLSRAAVADAGLKQLAAAPPALRDTRVGLELLGLSEIQIEEAMLEMRRAQGRAELMQTMAERAQQWGVSGRVPDGGNRRREHLSETGERRDDGLAGARQRRGF